MDDHDEMEYERLKMNRSRRGDREEANA